MTDLQNLVRQTSNPSILKMQKRLHEEVLKLGGIAMQLKTDNKKLIENLNKKEREWLEISQETDEIIAAINADRCVMRDALLEVLKVLESDDPAIVDTVWVSGGQPQTLRDLCFVAVYGEDYDPNA